MGSAFVHPITGAQTTAKDHPLQKSEAPLEETLDIVARLRPNAAVLTYIEEPDDLSYDDLIELEQRPEYKKLRVRFAYDTMIVKP